LQTGPTNRTKKIMLGLGRRSKAAGDLRAYAGNIRDPNRKGKVVIDIMGEPGGPPKIPGVGPLCTWRSPRASGITFRVAPPSFDIPKSQVATSDKVPPESQPNANVDKGKLKGKKKIWQP
jgi:hypothetical protein